MTLPNEQGLPLADVAVAQLKQYFFNRIDVLVVRASWGKPCPAITDNLDVLLRSHVLGDAAAEASIVYQFRDQNRGETGHYRVGSYAPGPGDTTRWLCIDFDAGNDEKSYPLVDATAALWDTLSRFAQLGIPAYPERSGGGQGWHLWVFFAEPIAADKARRLALRLIPAGILLANGSPADPKRNKGIEVFPKKTKLNGGLGSMVWLPYWSGAAPGGNQFYGLTSLSALGPHAFESFHTCSLDLVEQVLVPPPGSATAQVLAGVTTDEGANDEPDFRAKAKGQSDEVSQEWRAWRGEALAHLDLEGIYGEWLTGAKRPGWLECRDPIHSTTGDQHPSAAVADGTSQAQYKADRGDFYSFITAECTSVFDFLMGVGRAPNFIEAARIVAEASGVPLPKFDPEVEDTGSPESAVAGKQVIIVNNRQPIDVIADAWNALTAENHRPTLYRRSVNVIRIKRTDHGDLHVAPLGADDMAGMLYRVARWVRRKVVEGKIVLTDSVPPPYIARDMLNIASEKLPILEAVVRAPMFGASGKLVVTNGYYPEERLVLIIEENLVVPPVPEHPAPDEIAEARGLLLDDLLVDFDFKHAADRAHAVATLVLPFIRKLIPGPTPLHLVESPSPGSGKGLLCSVVTLVATGEDCPTRSLSEYDDEIRKMITAELSRAKPIILLDNINTDSGGKLDSASLAAALTTTVWTDRILKETRMADLPNQALWLLTANNPRLSMELARRSVRIRIVPTQDRPWLRNTFKHSDLKGWVRENRGKLVAAVLILVRAWQAVGSPRSSQRLGSYEPWSAVIGGILDTAGIPGFLHNLAEVYRDVDAESEPWRQFVEVWWERFRDQEVQVRTLNDLCNQEELLGGVRGDGTPRSQETKLGHALAGRLDRVFGQVKIRKAHRARGSWFGLVPLADASVSNAVGAVGQLLPLVQEQQS